VYVNPQDPAAGIMVSTGLQHMEAIQADLRSSHISLAQNALLQPRIEDVSRARWWIRNLASRSSSDR